jgi:Dolichyl-phosphate-mannose-protein mannosyltransferase
MTATTGSEPINRFSRNLDSICQSRRWLYALLLIGILLRLRTYLAARSLWLDESWLALNLIERDWAGLAGVLDYDQAAPFGFLLGVKCAITTLGDSELALRLLPFISGIAALLLLPFFLRRYTGQLAAFFTLLLFAINYRMVYYSCELKQYSTDALATLVLLLLTDAFLRQKKSKWRSALLLGIMGAVLQWFSFSSILVMAGIGAALGIHALLKKDRNQIVCLSLVGALWLSSFVVLYAYILRYTSNNEYLRSYWSGAFMPLLPNSGADAKWFIRAFFDLFKYQMNNYVHGLAAFIFLVGSFSLYKRDRLRFFLLTAPIATTLLASGFQRYPFGDRLILFLAPIILISVGEGVSYIAGKHRYGSPALALILIAAMFCPSLLRAAELGIRPREVEKMAPLVELLSEQYQADDTLHVYWGAEPALMYYGHRLDFHPTYEVGERDVDKVWSDFLDRMDTYKGRKRVWLLFSHVSPGRKYHLRHVAQYAERNGKLLQRHKRESCWLFLYDFSEAPKR